MDFGLTDEQRAIVATTRAFVERELYPHEEEVERTGVLRPELRDEIAQKAIKAGLYAANMPEEVGGAGPRHGHLGALREGARQGQLRPALRAWGGRPTSCSAAPRRRRSGTSTLRARRAGRLPGDDRARRGLRPARDAHQGDSRGRDGQGGWRIKGTKHFISHADESDFVILFARTDDAPTTATAKAISTFLVDLDTPGIEVHDGYRNVSHRGYTNAILDFDCWVPEDALLGEEGKGFDLAGTWLGSTRLQVAASCLGRAERALDLAVRHAAEREQFGQKIGRFQGISFKLADMALELRAAELLTLWAAWKYDQGTATDADIAMAKLKATEMLAMVADEAIQIHGGMGLMDELPLERIWRDARIERIWDGTSEIQRHIISRALLRPLGS